VNQVDRVLIVGDMHVVPEELEDCSKLASYIVRVADANDLHEIWFSGDQHHTHNVLRLEVLRWWKVVFKKLRAHGLNVVCLVGNHDQASPGSDLHAMMAYEDTPGVLIVDKPTVRLGVLLLPYYHEQEKFLDAVENATAKLNSATTAGSVRRRSSATRPSTAAPTRTASWPAMASTLILFLKS
jgi:DNA repair exonuclease SbcCD nuclease subunit